MTYSSEVLADSPSGFWLLNETSGTTLADSSGNGRTMTLDSGGTYAYNKPGPSVQIPAGFEFGATVASRAKTAVVANSSAATWEAWVRMPSLPTSRTALMNRTQGYQDGTGDKAVAIEPSGAVSFYTYDGSQSTLTSTAGVITPGKWHHIACAIGASGRTIRVDKAIVGSDGRTSSYSGTSALILADAPASGGTSWPGETVVQLAAVAFYPSQLSAARLDAHFDAAPLPFTGAWGVSF